MDNYGEMESIVRLKNIPIVEMGLDHTKAVYERIKVSVSVVIKQNIGNKRINSKIMLMCIYFPID